MLLRAENFRDIMLKARNGLCDEYLGLKEQDGKVQLQDPPVERDLPVSLDELFHGCERKLKITRRVSLRCGRFDSWSYEAGVFFHVQIILFGMGDDDFNIFITGCAMSCFLSFHFPFRYLTFLAK